MQRTFSRLLTLCTVLLAAPMAAPAQPLADRMPADAIVYAGWAGADSLGPQYDASHLKAVLEASNVPALVDEFLPKVFERIGQQDPQAHDALAGAASLGKLWHKPCAFAFMGVLNNP